MSKVYRLEGFVRMFRRFFILFRFFFLFGIEEGILRRRFGVFMGFVFVSV